MRKRIFAMLLTAAMLLSGLAMAETYAANDLTFDYDESEFKIAADETSDDGHLVVLSGTEEDWGDTYIRIYFHPLTDGEEMPTPEGIRELLPEVEVTQGEWNGYSDVISYFDGYESLFIVPLDSAYMTVGVGVSELDDEDDAMDRDDEISDVLDTLEVFEDGSEDSEYFTEEDFDIAEKLIEAEVAGWKGVEVISLSYAGDENNSEPNIDWLSGLEDEDFTQAMELLAEIHTTDEVQGALEPDTDYEDYQFWLARTDGGDWKLVSWGY